MPLAPLRITLDRLTAETQPQPLFNSMRSNTHLISPLRPAGKKPPVPSALPRVTMATTCCGVRLYTMPFTSVGTCALLREWRQIGSTFEQQYPNFQLRGAAVHDAIHVSWYLRQNHRTVESIKHHHECGVLALM